MRRWSFDAETFLITPDNNTPAPVCCQWYSPDDGSAFITEPWDDTTKALISDPQNHFVGQNIAYDLVLMMRWEPWCIPHFVRALDEGRIHDTMLREQLLHLEQVGDRGFTSRFSLEMLCKKYLGIDVSADKRGDDIWRLKYGTLYKVPIAEWPYEAVRYGIDDVVHTWDVYANQGGIEGRMPTEELQVYASIVLQAASAWGFQTNQDAVTKHEEQMLTDLERLDKEIKAETKQWVEANLGVDGDEFNLTGTGSTKNLTMVVQQAWRIKYAQIIEKFASDYSIGCDLTPFWNLPMEQDWKHTLSYYEGQSKLQEMPAAFWDAQQFNPPAFVKALIGQLPDIPRTKKGVSTAEGMLEPLFNIVPFLRRRVEYKHVEKMYSTYIVPAKGKRAFHPRYTTIVTTGRVSCDKPNLQNYPSILRDTVMPREGHVFGVVDYSGIEMTTLAATIKERGLGNALETAINAGDDLHCRTAAMLMGKQYEEVLENKKVSPYKEQRQGAKACYSADTEFLTKEGWRRSDDLYFNDPDVPIAQYCPHSKRITLAEPNGWVHRRDSSFVRVLNDYQDALVTPDHRMLQVSKIGAVRETLAESFCDNDQYSCVHGGTFGRDANSITLSDELTRVAVMVQADGNYQKQKVRLGFVKPRKISRCSSLLKAAGIDYTRDTKNGVTTFKFSRECMAGLLTDEKGFIHTLHHYDHEAFCNELFRWDGHIIKKHTALYFNARKDDVSFAQTVLVLSGYKATLARRGAREEQHQTQWVVSWYLGDRKKNPAYARCSGVRVYPDHTQGDSFCPSVPTSWVLTRRNGKVVVHGNCNFGLPGGLGAKAFVAYAHATYGVDFTLDEARAAIRTWKKAWPDVGAYLKKCGEIVDNSDGRRATAWNNSGRKKANCIYTQFCNYPFQSLAADGAKAAMIRIWREIMLSWFCEAYPDWQGYGSEVRGSPLRYSHLVNMVHDEIVCEHHASVAQQAYALQEQYMVEEMSKYTNGITVRVEGQLSEQWVH